MLEFLSEISTFNLTKAEIVRPVLEQIFIDYTHILRSLNIVFMTDDELLTINQEYLQHDYYTDIITFNYSEEEKIIEGELYISMDRVKENADTEGVDFWNELYRVMIHGCLHLVGYDDQTIALREAMKLVEDKYINTICFT